MRGTARPGPARHAAVAKSSVVLGTSRLGRSGTAGPADGDDDGEPDAASVDLAVAMLTAGYPLIDTANGYAGGRSERALGLAVRELGGLPEGVSIVSKVGADPDTGRLDGERVHRAFGESLERLGLERLPLYHLHDPHGLDPVTAAAPGGAVDALVGLRDQGLVDAIGVATGPLDELGDFFGLGVFDAMLTHNRFTLADRSAEPLIRSAGERGATVFNAAPFGGGLLADASPARRSYAYRPAGPEVLGRAEELRRLCAEAGVPLGALALHAATAHPSIDHVVVGVSSRQRLEELDALVAVELSPTLLAAVEALGPPPLAA